MALTMFRAAAAAALWLELPTKVEALARLYEVATGPGRDVVLLDAVEGTVHERLSG
ncbi:hypothetical protein [Kitasatospora sp. NPDC087315]|uniref:hypothetical protein n=1 Tax=Kitasatospora sp. NPDC087315 TaxID=3364069 RepID=UPI0037F3B1A7